MKRGCGVLLPVFSLPGAYGIGCFSEKAYEFIDHLQKAGQMYWQLLPLGPTGYGDSPYQSFSAFAGNPFFIDLDALLKEGLLAKERLDGISEAFQGDGSRVSYGRVWESRKDVLREAYACFLDRTAEQNAEEAFLNELNTLPEEIKTYALFRTIKDSQGGKCWTEWERALSLRDPLALQEFRASHEGEIRYYLWEQLQFRRQWKKLKEYANARGIRIIGDMPIYVAADSADAWAHPKLFQFDEEAHPKAVAGCPPDYFSPGGQLWGNPLYQWEEHEKTGYAWWIARLEEAFSLYDFVRIDHFRAFADYYAIPTDAKTAAEGAWKKGPGISFFEKMREHFSGRFETLPMIAEDLGLLSDAVVQLVKDSGFPSMKVLEFGFDGDPRNLHLLHNFPRHSVAYTGTHDNEPLVAWIRNQDADTRLLMIRYLGGEHTPEYDLHWDCIRSLLASVSDTVIIPMWDYLGMGEEARVNTPAVSDGNWSFRLPENFFGSELIWHMNLLSELYGRKPE